MGYKINNRKNCKGYILICFDKVPKDCSECKLWQDNSYELEESFFGDGIIYSCPFGGDNFGCCVERPKNCPIITPENKKYKLK